MLYPKDPKVRVEPLPDGLLLEWKQDRGSALFILVMGVVIEALGFLMAALPRKDGAPRTTGEIIGFIAIMSICGLPLIYGGLATLLDTTRIRASRGSLICTTGPIWMGPSTKVDPTGIKQFFSPAGSPTSTRSVRLIYAMDANDHVRLLAKNLPSSFAASQVCHELAVYYRIPDLPVFGVTTDPAHPGPRSISS